MPDDTTDLYRLFARLREWLQFHAPGWMGLCHPGPPLGRTPEI